MNILNLNLGVPWVKYNPTNITKNNNEEVINLSSPNFNFKLQSYEDVEAPEIEEKSKKKLNWFSNSYSNNISSNTESSEASSYTQKVSSDYIINYFVNKGLTYNQARGIYGNLKAESGNISNILQGGKRGSLKIDGKTGYGLAQWTSKDRQQRLYTFAKTNNPTTKQQLDFIWWELNNTHKHALQALKNTNSIEQATKIVMDKYENPGIKRWNERLKFAING